MKKLSLIVFVIFSVLTLKSQTLKTYDGEMVGDIDVGKVTYTYILDSNGNEVKHGTYKFIEKNNTSEGGSYFGILTGNFKNGFKNGSWTYLLNLIDYPAVGDVYTTSSLNVKMNYVDGLPDGNWSYSYSGKYRERLYSLSGWSWKSYQLKTPETIQLNWNNGILIGNLIFRTPYCNIIGQLDQNGRWVGKWVLDKEQTEYILEDGILKSGLNRDWTGNSAPIKYDKELLSLQDEYKSLSENERKRFVIKHRIKVDTIQGIK